MARTVLVSILAAVAAGAACGSNAPAPAALDSGHDVCAYCRMIVSDRRFASQIVAPLEEPKFFDDLGCLANYLKGAGSLDARTTVYVADHSTLAWVPARAAVFTRVETLTAPMGSHLVAHASASTRAADPAASAGTPVSLSDAFPGGLGGSR
ncbi:MAG TPA: nitrous oxide reductase accessory protein NosL [Vicinamibacterales bacterium]|nr:nitrous oxide reductase accessory protein NosL [Vicinamibacterales bacterium]